MNDFELIIRIFIARVQEFIRKHIVADDPAPAYSRLDEMDRK